MPLPWMGSVPRRCATLMVALFFGVAGGPARPDERPIVVKRETTAGHDVRVRGFAEFDGNCARVPGQTVKVVDAPAHGRVDKRPEPVAIGPNWVGRANCEGKTLEGITVYYVPEAGFTGTDRFSIDVSYTTRRTVRAEVEVEVRYAPSSP